MTGRAQVLAEPGNEDVETPAEEIVVLAGTATWEPMLRRIMFLIRNTSSSISNGLLIERTVPTKVSGS